MKNSNFFLKAVYKEKNWAPAIVPGIVLNLLVFKKVYPETYYEINSKSSNNIIREIAVAGRNVRHATGIKIKNVKVSYVEADFVPPLYSRM